MRRPTSGHSASRFPRVLVLPPYADRLARTRGWPDQIRDPVDYGTDLAYLQDLCWVLGDLVRLAQRLGSHRRLGTDPVQP